jgi:glycosyltransferase involved in cell wall biosynthesis
MICDVDVGRPDATRTHTVEVARWLAADGGYDVLLVTRGADPGIAGVRHRSAGPAEMRLSGRLRAVNAAAVRALREERRLGASRAYVRHYWGLVPVYAAARRLGFHVVVQVDDLRYGPGRPEPPRGPRAWAADRARRIAARRMVRTAAQIVAVTGRIGALLVDHFGAARERVHALPNGVDVDEIRPVDRAAAIAVSGLDPACAYVLFMGQLAPWVDLDTMLRAFALVHERRDDARFLLVGDGSEAARAEALVGELGLDDSVIRTGFVSERERVGALVGASTVCLTAHRAEHVAAIGVSPVKLAEYFAAGRAVVGIDVPGVREMLAETGAGIAVAADPERMAEAILELLDDPARADELGAAGRRAAEERYSWRSVVARTLPLLDPSAPA